MAYVITDDCVECGSCAAVCPADAISEGDGKYVIDADACLECGTCEAECRTRLFTLNNSNNQADPEPVTTGFRVCFVMLDQSGCC